MQRHHRHRFNPKAYILLAGFVEFFLADFLLGGRFFGRLAALGLLGIFAAGFSILVRSMRSAI
jgi:hypothetical protein